MSRKNKKLLDSKNRMILILAIVNASLLGGFGIIVSINLDSLQNVNVEFDFTIADTTFPMVKLDDISNIQNVTLSRNEIQISEIFISYNTEFRNLNNSQLNNLMINATRENNFNFATTIDQQIFILGISTIEEFRPRTFYFKIPRGNRFSFISAKVRFTKDTYFPIEFHYFGFLEDVDNSKAITDYSKNVININSFEFNETLYSDFYNYMSGNTNEIPETYPYYVNFDISKETMQIIDYFR
jgi:hypothetical protein